jgi:hypothetical protein
MKGSIVKAEFISQYAHTWRVFESLVQDFEAEAWFQTGRGAITPVRLSWHILQSVKYYLADSAPLQFTSGQSFEGDWATVAESPLPSQADIVACLLEMQVRTEKWLVGMNASAPNEAFPWAGDTQLGVMIFLLRHSLFHLGELSSLLNESKHGQVADHYVGVSQS